MDNKDETAMTFAETAISFLRLVSSGHVREAYAQHVHKDFTHHNPYFPGDRQALMKGMEESAQKWPDKNLHILRFLEDKDMVAVHSRIRLGPSAPDMAVIHLFKFRDGLIIEEWETMQQVPEDSPNENGIF